MHGCVTMYWVLRKLQAAGEFVGRQYVDVLTTHHMHVYILTIFIIPVGRYITQLALCKLYVDIPTIYYKLYVGIPTICYKLYVDIPTICYKHVHILTVGIYAGLRNHTFGFAHTANSDGTRLQTTFRCTHHTHHACLYTHNIHHT